MSSPMSSPITFQLSEWKSELGKKTLFEARGNLDVLLGEGASLLGPKDLKTKIEEINNDFEIRLYLDISGSMKNYLEATKDAAKALLKTVAEGTSVNIYTFDSQLYTILECEKMPALDSEERNLIVLKLDKIENNGGNTNIFNVLKHALTDFNDKNKETLISVISDGNANHGPLITSSELLAYAKGESHLVKSSSEKFGLRTFYFLGFQQNPSDVLNADLMNGLSKITNGKFTLTKDPREFIDFTASIRAHVLRVVKQMQITAFSSNGFEGKSILKSGFNGWTLEAGAPLKLMFEWPEGALGPYTFMVKAMAFGKLIVLTENIVGKEATLEERISMAKRMCGNALETYSVNKQLIEVMEKLFEETGKSNKKLEGALIEIKKVTIGAPPPLRESGFTNRVTARANYLSVGADDDDFRSPAADYMNDEAHIVASSGGGGGGGGGGGNI
jgi:hypothetical protein